MLRSLVPSPIKTFLKRTPVYRYVRARRAKRALASWTPEDEKRAAFYSQFVSKGDRVFDVGANVGNRVKVFLHLGANVLAVEPQRHCVSVLRSAFKTDRLTIFEGGVSAAVGEMQLYEGEADTVSTMSREWMDAVRASGRFSDQRWAAPRVVPVTTLDRLIEAHGEPAFVKIDVEGYEYEVIRGLTRPLRALSLEFGTEVLDVPRRCLDHLAALGPIETNYGLGETPALVLAEWVEPTRLMELLNEFQGRSDVFGDIYVRSIVR